MSRTNHIISEKLDARGGPKGALKCDHGKIVLNPRSP